jgi:hypothetical protein
MFSLHPVRKKGVNGGPQNGRYYDHWQITMPILSTDSPFVHNDVRTSCSGKNNIIDPHVLIEMTTNLFIVVISLFGFFVLTKY